MVSHGKQTGKTHKRSHEAESLPRDARGGCRREGKVRQGIRGQEAGHGRTHAFRLRASGIERQAEVRNDKRRVEKSA